MLDLATGVTTFRDTVFPAKAGLFTRLASTHAPHTLFVGCSDARVVPELITSSEPGELFVIRTAGNLVPAYRADGDGVTASVEYAVEVLGVRRIVVCGHSSCGAMTALAERRDLTATPTVAGWLRHADAAVVRCTGPDAVAAMVRANVRAQLANLTTHPAVARALADDRVALEGWVFDIGSGSIASVDSSGD
ncbi:carbonic anhydrase [Nocardia sp. NEAU-G5]|uniref:Carbonic anhydrase n=1 Tax=Nocardia albiluteola TaxID=2842303 RepID=A0ABS6AXH7_9NOCA|nr:carbonic anhydrase [Nocardia albiluteola]MBU3062221.1 carbonic anhydrase [Nocardia albiluteola]